MIGIEKNGEAKALRPERFNELVAAWHKGGDVSVELRALLVTLGWAEWGGDNLVLTDAGLAAGLFLQSLIPVPVYDLRTGRLCWKGRLIKTLRRKAGCQRAILEAFASAGWPRLLDDPLGVAPPEQARERLRQTIKNLNKSMEPDTIRFHTDGRGQAVRWESCGD